MTSIRNPKCNNHDAEFIPGPSPVTPARLGLERGLRSAFFFCILTSAVCILPGCGYSTDSLYRSDIKTVYVETFSTKEFRRDIEFQLTEAVKKRIAMDTPYRVAPKEKADTILMGEVLEVRQSAFAPDPESRQPREKQLTLSARLVWKDLRTGKVLVDQPLQLQSADYLTPTGETEKFAIEKSVDGMAQRIVAKMYAEW